jgi:hypothetical protein
MTWTEEYLLNAVFVCYRSEPCNTLSNDPAEGEEEEILGSDDDEQEDPRDYCRGDECL